jgi:uncharacterized membrane protein YoaK (UPF0700 family)
LIGTGAVASAMMGLVGPFGSYGTDPPVTRVLFWTLVIGLSLPIAVACRVVVDRHLAQVAFWPRALMVCAAFTLLYAPVLRGILHLRIGAEHEETLNFPEMAALVFAIALLINAFDRVAGLGLAEGQPLAGWSPSPVAGEMAPAPGGQARPVPAARGEAPGPTATPPASAAPRLLSRLPAGVRGEVLSVSVRDHYIDVYTSRGTAELLFRLSDAIGELDGVDGAQVHRSHWVARAAVAAVERGRGRIALRLVDGRTVPVSRGRLAALSERGWI